MVGSSGEGLHVNNRARRGPFERRLKRLPAAQDYAWPKLYCAPFVSKLIFSVNICNRGDGLFSGGRIVFASTILLAWRHNYISLAANFYSHDLFILA